MCIWKNLKINKNAAPDNPPCFFEILFYKILINNPKEYFFSFSTKFSSNFLH
jgi:hypothetical protein